MYRIICWQRGYVHDMYLSIICKKNIGIGTGHTFLHGSLRFAHFLVLLSQSCRHLEEPSTKKAAKKKNK